MRWYEILWSNINRSMEGIWKTLAPITVVGTIVLAIEKGYVTYPIGSALVFLILLWGLNLTVDLNNWHRRNLCFLTAVEREFLRNNDYGRLTLSKYRKPSHKWITFYKINFITFSILLLVCIIYFCCASTKQKDMLWSWVLLIIGIGVTCYNIILHERAAKERLKELFQNDKDTEKAGRP